MNSKSSILVAVVCLMIGIALGAFLARRFPREPQPPAARPAPVKPQKRIEVDRTEAEAGSKRESAAPPLQHFRTLLLAKGQIDLAQCLAAIQRLPLSDCRAALQILGEIESPERFALLSALANRWAELDGEDALRVALAERDSDFSRPLGTAAGAALVKQNTEGALQRIMAAAGPASRYQLAEWILKPLAEINPRRAAEFISANKSLQRHLHLYSAVAREFGIAEPEAAMKWAAALTGSAREQAESAALAGWAKKDPAKVAAVVEQNAKWQKDSGLNNNIAREWSATDPAAALAWIDGISDKGRQSEAIAHTRLDVEKLGVEAVRKLIEGVSSEEMRGKLTQRVAADLARDDVSRALQWVEGLPEGERSNALLPVIAQWTERNPIEAATFIRTLPEGVDRADEMQRAIAAWSQTEPKAAFNFVQQLPAGRERDQATGELARAMREEDPKLAMQWLRMIEDAEVVAEVVGDLVGALVQNDRATAIALATELPTEAQANAFGALISTWAAEEAPAAGEWINTLPRGAGRDAAVQAYVDVIDGVDPAAATKWAESIEDPLLKVDSVYSSFERWIDKDKEAARQWLRETDLPEGFRPFFEKEMTDADKPKKM